MLRGCLEAIRRYQGVFMVYDVSETALGLS